MIDTLVGIAGLPIGVILFLNEYGFTKINTIFGMDILLIAAITLILIQISNILGAHIMDENVFLSYIIHAFMIFPSVIFFLSYIMTIPANIVNSLPIVFASFILIEGMYSFFF